MTQLKVIKENSRPVTEREGGVCDCGCGSYEEDVCGCGCGSDIGVTGEASTGIRKRFIKSRRVTEVIYRRRAAGHC